MIQNLLFCPLCGKSATVVENIGRNEGEKAMFHAACNNYRCGLYSGLRPWRATKEEAIAAWNRRPDPWIPVTERLPDEAEIFIGWHEDGFVLMTENIFDEMDGVTHWMPLPSPPKGERDK